MGALDIYEQPFPGMLGPKESKQLGALAMSLKKSWDEMNPAQKIGMSPVGFPVTDAIGLAGDIQMYKEHPEQRGPLNYSLSALGMLPFVPGMVKAFHGSPYKFDRFSLEKVGTGEGAQAYGHGLYFAGDENIANFYKNKLTDRHAKFDVLTSDENKVLPDWVKNHISNNKGDVKGIKEMMDEFQKRIDDIEFQEMGTGQPWLEEEKLHGLKKINEVLDKLYHSGKEGRISYSMPEGSVYKVKVDVDPDDLLDWDKPLSQQPEKVKQALQKINVWDDLAEYNNITPGSEITGGQFYRKLSKMMGRTKGASDADISKMLNEAGIPGMRYLDSNSRPKGYRQPALTQIKEMMQDKTHNMVIFDDTLVDIEK